MPEIKIYQSSSCPFCIYVKNSCDKLGLVEGEDYELVPAARGTPGRESLLRIGGKGQVPFMLHGDVKMYESRDIVNYLIQYAAEKGD